MKPKTINIQITYKSNMELKQLLEMVKKQCENGVEALEVTTTSGAFLFTHLYFSEPRIGREAFINGKHYMIYKSHIDYL